MEDQRIIEMYEKRSEVAIAYTAEKYGAYAKRIAFNVLGSTEDSEECVSDAYLKLWNAIPPAVPKCFKAFLGKIVKNLALDRLDLETAKKRGGGEIVLCLDELEECVPAKEMETGELTEAINQFLKSVDEKKAKIFVRRYWYQDSIKEIAICFGMTDNNVKTVLFRLRSDLKAYLEKEGINI